MNKHLIIVIITSIVIAGSFGFSFWNVYASDQVQIKAVKEGYFSYFDLTTNPNIDFCNPLPIGVSFRQVEIAMIYNDKNLGVVDFSDVLLEPNSETQLKGKFVSDNIQEAQYYSMHFDGMYNGVIPGRIDIENMKVSTEIETQIIGLVPFSITKQYPGLEFWYLMNNEDWDYRC